MAMPTSQQQGPIRVMLRYWLPSIVLIILGLVAGAVVGSRVTTDYTAESRLTVGSGDLSSYEVPGFASASEQLASNYARYVDNSSIVSEKLQKALGNRTSQLVGIGASPIPGSSVISVEAVATSRRAAVDGAKSVASTLVDLTHSTQPGQAASLLNQYKELATQTVKASAKVTALQTTIRKRTQAKLSVTEQQQQLAQAQVAVSQLQLQQTAVGSAYQTAVSSPTDQSQLVLVQAAAIISDNSSRHLQIYTVAGVVGGALVALVLSNLLARRRPRRRASSHTSSVPERDAPGSGAAEYDVLERDDSLTRDILAPRF